MRTTSPFFGWRAVFAEWPLLLLVFLVGVFSPRPCPGQNLLKNIQADPSIPGNSHPYGFQGKGRLAFFWASLHRGALLRTDGTLGGTQNLMNGQGDFPINDGPTGLSFNNIFYFVGFGYRVGKELFRSDGTYRGTYLLQDLYPGSRGIGNPNDSWPRDFVVAGKFLYFHADTSKGDTLFRTDGTTNGTIALYQSPGTIEDLTPFGAMIVFLDKKNSSTGGDLGISNGTPAGTRLISNLLVLDHLTKKKRFGVLGTKVFFQARKLFASKKLGPELWVSDGTKKGTKLFKDLWPGSVGSTPTEFATVGSKLFFNAFDKALGNELWVSDGTPGGTKVLDLNPGKPGGNPSELTPFGGKLLFKGYTSSRGEEPWISDGTAKGTFLLKDLAPGSSGSLPRSFASAGKWAFFLTSLKAKGNELFKTDGTPAGTKKVIDLPPLTNPNFIQEVVAYGNKVLFQRNSPKTGEEPWISDGTPAGTKLLRDLVPNWTKPASSNPREFTDLGDKVFFGVQPVKAPPALWQTNGRTRGTSPLSVPIAGTGLSALGSSLVWVGTRKGSSSLFGYNKGTKKTVTLFSSPQKLQKAKYAFSGFQLYKVADSGKGPSFLSTDGTKAGTKTFIPPTGKSGDQLSEPLPFGKQVVLAGPYRTTPSSKVLPLWITDGTSGGTKLLASLPLKTPIRSVQLLSPVRMGKALYFFLRMNLSSLVQTILWKTDGTPTGTVPLKAFPSILVDGLMAWNGKLFFAGFDQAKGVEPWISDGTPGGTKMLKDLTAGFWHSFPRKFTPRGKKLLFQANDLLHGVELFITDGTPGGTTLLKDVHPGFKDGIGPLFALGSRFVGFFGDDGQTGLRFWISDGTFAGTRPATAKLPPNQLGAPLSHFHFSRGQLFFAWPHPTLGVEPWTWFPGATARAYGKSCGSKPILEATDPVLGGRIQFQGKLDPKQGVGVLLLGFTAKTPLRVSADCLLRVDPFGFLLPIPVQAQQGSFKVAFGVPNLMNLSGLLLQSQVLHPLGGGGFDLSNPVELALGK